MIQRNIKSFIHNEDIYSVACCEKEIHTFGYDSFRIIIITPVLPYCTKLTRGNSL